MERLIYIGDGVLVPLPTATTCKQCGCPDCKQRYFHH